MSSPVTAPCHEIAIFKQATAASPAQVFAALKGVDPWLSIQPGFLGRTIRYDVEHGVWIDLVEWASRSYAMVAMQRAAEEPSVAALITVIDPTTMQMLHGEAFAGRSS